MIKNSDGKSRLMSFKPRLLCQVNPDTLLSPGKLSGTPLNLDALKKVPNHN